MLSNTTQKELNDALAEGYTFLEVSTVGENVVALGRVAKDEGKPQEQK
jgi:hypothetical protein